MFFTSDNDTSRCAASHTCDVGPRLDGVQHAFVYQDRGATGFHNAQRRIRSPQLAAHELSYTSPQSTPRLTPRQTMSAVPLPKPHQKERVLRQRSAQMQLPATKNGQSNSNYVAQYVNYFEGLTPRASGGALGLFQL
eukprot:gnl/TRDRNA2_/TRDRNA2_78599_c0_seq1.p1 gnl/TRDRNA2_/TRDRNA2_78599_c0~~gnl/TRDRNA2_/TRDRNA2_78599_c0_seq1.p1  ORF type:complete len:151 (+),score=3.43 gnl/TRDRNA2_/TRDRNA2_78599_c0_seq1:44-454(+)